MAWIVETYAYNICLLLEGSGVHGRTVSGLGWKYVHTTYSLHCTSFFGVTS